MPKRDSAYWITRAERVIVAGEKNALEYERDLRIAYDKALKAMQTELQAFFQKYAKENNISYNEARKKLSNKELKSFLEQQRNYLAEVERLGGYNKDYVSYLRNLSGRAYVTKLEELQANLRYHIETLTANYETGTHDLLKTDYEDSYYRTLFNVQSGTGFGVDFTAPGAQQLEAAVQEKWNGDNYSGRIWANKAALLRTLDQMLPQEFARGRSIQQISRDLEQRMGVSYSNAVRLVRTEVNYICNKGTLAAYKDSEVVQEFEYVATLDGRTSEICIEMDGKIFKLSDAKIGINVPPLHPHCRSTTVPHFADDIYDEPTDRVARDKNGRTYLVGADVTWKQWVDKYAEAEYAKKAA